MADKAQVPELKPVETTTAPAAATPGAAPAPRRPPGHRSTDARDTVAEMAARAQEISMEAGSKVAAAMKDVINAAAGLAGFAVESARDLVQYMVRRGQMTQEEADKLLREAEEANSKRKPFVKAAAPERAAAPASIAPTPAFVAPIAVAPAAAPKPPPKPLAKKVSAGTSKGSSKAASRSKPAAASRSKARARPASKKKK